MLLLLRYRDPARAIITVGIKPMEERSESVQELKTQLEETDVTLEQKIKLLNSAINSALHTDTVALTRVTSELYHSGVLRHCVHDVLSLDGRRLQGHWSSASTLAQLTSSCCAAVDPGDHWEAFHTLFLPSVVDALLSLAAQMTMMRTTSQGSEGVSMFRTVMDSVSQLLTAHAQLSSQVLSSVHYEHIQMCDDVTVSLMCINMWIQTCSVSRNFLSSLSDDSILLLLSEAVGQLAVSADSAVGGASVRLLFLMSSQLHVWPLLLSFRGLDNLLDKDWRGRGFDQDVDQLIKLMKSHRGRISPSQESSERVRAACVIQAAWRSHQTRRRVKSLSRAVSSLQRSFRARRKQQQQQEEAQKWEEELKYQVCLRRKQARRAFHEKQRKLLQLLPPGDHTHTHTHNMRLQKVSVCVSVCVCVSGQVQSYLSECERCAAVRIQSLWRGFRDRRLFTNTYRRSLRERRAATTLQRAVRRFLQRRRAAKAPPTTALWLGHRGLTDSSRAELKAQVEEYVAAHPSSCVSREECERLHVDVQLLLQAELQRGDERRREEQRREALLAHTHTLLEQLREAPPLSVVTATVADSFLSPSGVIAARARDSHNALLQETRLPWWRTLGEAEDVLGPAQPLVELEAELGGLFVGGTV
ncbi:IQ calmodulin-binding motif-containing protein 1 isoform X2 [Solea solea]|uniref:IQ calmodulin-binding motif-containing protein 1 isoform X2 n=1 Tax=Solea solea TaxID=90069 RepID=UPI00272D9F03|nr:IQ calmodulin-binding motif-containing protein 1 isoform X2 [Solea solea]